MRTASSEVASKTARSVFWYSSKKVLTGRALALASEMIGKRLSSSSLASALNAAEMAPSSTSTSSPVICSYCRTAEIRVERSIIFRGANEAARKAGAEVRGKRLEGSWWLRYRRP